MLLAAATTRRSLALAVATTTARLKHRPLLRAAASSSSSSSSAAAADAEKPMRLDKLLSSLGYGSRREVAALIRSGRVQVLDEGGVGAAPPKNSKKQQQRLSADSRAAPSRVRLDGAELDPRPPLTLLINKPDGYTVTSPDDPRVSGPTVYDLLPERFGARKPFLGPAGRLDKRTSGLMVLTDDGQLAHRITSPKKVLWKEYEAALDAPMSGEELRAAARLFASGEMVLAGDDGSPSAGRPLLPARLSWEEEEEEGGAGAAATAGQTVRVRVCEGRYHQVRRMMAAVGREVVELRRVAMGRLALLTDAEEEEEGEEEEDQEGGGGGGITKKTPKPNGDGGDGTKVAVRLAPGEWRAATAVDLEALFGGGGGLVAGGGGGVEGGGAAVEAAAAAAAEGRGGSGGGGDREPGLDLDEEAREMHRRARVDARRREKRKDAKAAVGL